LVSDCVILDRLAVLIYDADAEVTHTRAVDYGTAEYMAAFGKGEAL
jgi:hypothetical protein